MLIYCFQEYADGVNDVNLMREPVKETVNGQKVYYNSVMVSLIQFFRQTLPCYFGDYSLLLEYMFLKMIGVSA